MANNESFKGFFGIVKPGSTISNLTLNNVCIKSGNGMMIGSAVGYIPKGSSTEPTTIDNVHVKGLIEIDANSNAGIILGRSEAGSGKVIITNCTVEGEEGSYISGECNTNINFIGGIAGAIYGNEDNVIDNCSVEGVSITGKCAGVGGIAGFVEKGTISNCTVKNVVLKDTCDPNVDIMSMVAVGAIAGTFCSDSSAYKKQTSNKTLAINNCTVENVEVNVNDWVNSAIAYGEGSTNSYNLEIAALGNDAKEAGSKGPVWDCWPVVGTNRWLDQVNPEKDDVKTYITTSDGWDSLKAGITVKSL